MNDSEFTADEKLFGYWHRRLRHAPKKYIRRLAKRGCIPCRLAKVKRMPLCPACVFADASKTKWRTKKVYKSIRKKSDKPGSSTSGDHIISHEPGLIPQVTGRLTYAKYDGAVVFSDHYSDFTYVHLITSTSDEETLLAKRAYERVAREHGIMRISHYHSDNLQFNSANFTSNYDRNNQKYTYCGIGAHH